MGQQPIFIIIIIIIIIIIKYHMQLARTTFR